MPISLNSDKIQKRTVPHLKAENLIITVHFMHFLGKITVRAVTDQNACIIFFVTVSRISKGLLPSYEEQAERDACLIRQI